jgi:hypothetical protein
LSKKRLCFFDSMGGKSERRTTESRILARVRERGPGTVFTASDFFDLGAAQAVYQALTRSAASGVIRKIARGVFEYPRVDPDLGVVAPDLDAVARAVQGRDATRLVPSGAHAANMLGLSTQVPMKTVFLTDGRARTVQLGKRQLVLKHSTPRFLATAGRVSGTVIQALRWIGQGNVDDETIAKLRRRLTAAEKKQLLADVRFAPAWVAKHMREIAEPRAGELR